MTNAKIKNSFMRKVEYDTDKIRVTFGKQGGKNRSQYEYATGKNTLTIINGWKKAASKGRYFWKAIRRVYIGKSV